MSKQTDTYSIRQVMDLTGLSEFTLRGWETRYKAFAPRRTATGRRVYSAVDLQKAILLRELTVRDHRIGDIASLPPKDLQRLMENVPVTSSGAPGKQQAKVEKIFKYISLQRWDEARAELRRAFRTEKTKELLSGLVAPLVQELGNRVAGGLISISQEHIFSSLLKERLFVLGEQARKGSGSARFVVAAPEADFHELGILIARTMIAHAGFSSLYLGPNTPKKDLCEVALRLGATHILLGSTVSRQEGAKEDLYSYIHFLDQNLSPGMSIWLGGRNTSRPLGEMARPLVSFSSLADLSQALEEVH